MGSDRTSGEVYRSAYSLLFVTLCFDIDNSDIPFCLITC